VEIGGYGFGFAAACGSEVCWRDLIASIATIVINSSGP
jgi:hypothetical protein